MDTSYTILYIEDDHDDVMLISEAFEEYTDHLRVIHACNGYEGLGILKEMKEKGSLPCLIILDINMPVMDGRQTLKKIREHKDFRHLPVVMFSTSNSHVDKLFAKELKADFITKPISFSDMQSLVSQFISKCKFEMAGRV